MSRARTRADRLVAVLPNLPACLLSGVFQRSPVRGSRFARCDAVFCDNELEEQYSVAKRTRSRVMHARDWSLGAARTRLIGSFFFTLLGLIPGFELGICARRLEEYNHSHKSQDRHNVAVEK